MKICFAVLYHDSKRGSEDPAAYLDRVPLLRHLPQELAARDHEITVVQQFPRDGELTENGVEYHFVAESWLARGLAKLALFGRGVWVPARRSIDRVQALEPDVIHFHGTVLSLNLTLLLRRLGLEAPPFVIHHHGGEPARNRWLRRLQRRALRRAEQVLFSTRSHAQPFVATDVLRSHQVIQLMETSSAFRIAPRSEARRVTGMRGDPVYLCAGRLHPIKDPLTVLRGFDRIAAEQPEARLYFRYLSDELLPELRAELAGRPDLAAKVRFDGRAELAEMEAIFNSADFVLQASRREFSGVAILDAMACGTIPIVTDIPSFRAMTVNGRHGALFPVGDADELARAALSIPREEIAERSAAVAEHFQERMSFAATARKLEEIYLNIYHPSRA